MAKDKKSYTEETEKNNTTEKKDSLDELSFEDDEDYSYSSDEAEFDSFMSEFRELVGKTLKSDEEDSSAQEVEEDDPEEVLVSLPKKQWEDEPVKVKSDRTNGWNDEITLEPAEYESLEENDEGTDSEPIIEDFSPEIQLGEEEDDSFQLSIDFGFGEDSSYQRSEGDEGDEDEETTSQYDPDHPRAVDWVFDIAEMFVFVLLAVVLLTSFVFRHSIVEGRSMNNTLADGDHLIISNLFYTPERGDIIVFEDYSTILKKAVVKRVIGLPGETVEIRLADNGCVTVYINGELLPENYAYNTVDAVIDPSTLNKPVVVGDDEVFVMGDNRYHSTDSRVSGVGPIKIDSILGKALIRFYPFDKFGPLN